jgi:hypothetical protein
MVLCNLFSFLYLFVAEYDLKPTSIIKVYFGDFFEIAEVPKNSAYNLDTSGFFISLSIFV